MEKVNINPTVFERQKVNKERYSLEPYKQQKSYQLDPEFSYVIKGDNATRKGNPFDVDADAEDDDDKLEAREEIDAIEIYDLIRDIKDPEHPLSLEELNVVQKDLIEVDDKGNRIKLLFVPTVPHCSMSTLIGLCLRVKLLRSLPPRFKVDIYVKPGSHASEDQVNKQLNDKERVAAALENSHLIQVVNKCLESV